MNIVIRNIILFSCIFTLTACNTIPETKQSVYHIDGIDLLSRPVGEQLIVFQTPDDDELLCMVSSPDTVPTFTQSLSGGILGKDAGISQGVGAASLGGRDRAVLLGRDLLYRTCEFSLNYRLSKEEAKALYIKTLIHIENIAINYNYTSMKEEEKEEE